MRKKAGLDGVTLASLSPRLEAVLRLVPAGARLLDLGTDHAYLPIALLQRGVSPWAVGVDVRPGPLAQARANRDAAGLTESQLELRLGDGLAAVGCGEVDVAVLAGMGGLLMLQALDAVPAVRQSLRQLVLAPNNHVAEVRRWAVGAGYAFVGEDLVAEGRQLYAVLALAAAPAAVNTRAAGDAAAPAGRAVAPAALSDVEAELGPLLLRQGHPLVPALARRLLGQARQALTELEQGRAQREAAAPSDDARLGPTASRAERRRQALAERIQTLEEVLACWPKWPI
ncbi:MAG: tRNA (adenine(22)-N(1))-methyltransferase [Symbiobacteriia bacterium]